MARKESYRAKRRSLRRAQYVHRDNEHNIPRGGKRW